MIQCQPVIVVLRYALFSPRVDRGLEQAFVSFSFLKFFIHSHSLEQAFVSFSFLKFFSMSDNVCSSHSLCEQHNVAKIAGIIT